MWLQPRHELEFKSSEGLTRLEGVLPTWLACSAFVGDSAPYHECFSRGLMTEQLASPRGREPGEGKTEIGVPFRT